MAKSECWWGDFPIAEQELICWSSGERKILLQRLKTEWNTWNVPTEAETDEPLVIQDWPQSSLPDNEHLSRTLQANSSANIRVRPALADRSFITRPNVPLKLLGGEKTRIFVSTPLWFKATTLPGKECLLDIPFWRPSDSWFGKSTREGEMCYAKYTEARLQLSLLQQRAQRAITPVSIHNKQKEPLLIERLNVPVTLLSLYHDAHQGLWTEALNLTCQGDDDQVELVLEKQAPAEVAEAQLLSEPRVARDKHRFIRTISSLLS